MKKLIFVPINDKKYKYHFAIIDGKKHIILLSVWNDGFFQKHDVENETRMGIENKVKKEILEYN